MLRAFFIFQGSMSLSAKSPGVSKETSSIVEALAGTRLFTSLPDSVLEELSSLFVERSFEEDEASFHQGDVGEALLIIKSGQARVEREIMDGRRVILALRGPGAVLGEMALLDGSPRSASVYAQEASTALSLARSSFFDLPPQLAERERRGGSASALRASPSTLHRARAAWSGLPVDVALRLRRVRPRAGPVAQAGEEGEERTPNVQEQ